jgi:hypothetical protein
LRCPRLRLCGALAFGFAVPSPSALRCPRLRLCGVPAFGFAVPPPFARLRRCRLGLPFACLLRCPLAVRGCAVLASVWGLVSVGLRWSSVRLRRCGLRLLSVSGRSSFSYGPRFGLTTVRPLHACGVAPRQGRRFPFRAPFPALSRPRSRPGPGPARLRLCGFGRLCRAPLTGGWAGWGLSGVLGLGGCGRRSVLGLWRCSGPVRRGSRPSGGGPSDGTVRHLPPPPGRGR